MQVVPSENVLDLVKQLRLSLTGLLPQRAQLAALSVDLRKRILDDIDPGYSAIAVAEEYHVARRTVNALVQHRRVTGTLEPIRGRQGCKSTLDPRKEEILQIIDQNSSVTHESLRSQLGLVISLPALWRTLRRWGIRLKKSGPRR